MFMGEYNHTVDAKGRVIVPSKFREQLGEEFVVTKGLDGCLFVYENTEWKALEEKLHALPLTNANARKFSRFFLAGATTCEVDRAGTDSSAGCIKRLCRNRQGCGFSRCGKQN